MKMRSYEAARGYFTFLAFLSWVVIALGAIVALAAMVAASQASRSFGGSPMAGLAGLIPGLMILFAGFIGLVFVQIGRAGVDSAEYAQQNLKIAREQLEISRHAHMEAGGGAPSFVEAVTSSDGVDSGVSFAQATNGAENSASDKSLEKTAAVLPPVSEEGAPLLDVNGFRMLDENGTQFEYRGYEFCLEDGKYNLSGQIFASAKRIKSHLENLKIRET